MDSIQKRKTQAKIALRLLDNPKAARELGIKVTTDKGDTKKCITTKM